MLFFKKIRICCSDDIIVQNPTPTAETKAEPIYVNVWNVSILVSSMADLHDAVHEIAYLKYGEHFLCDHQMWLQHCGKPLSLSKRLVDYNIQPHSQIEVRFSSMLGGSTSFSESILPISESVKIERMMMKSTFLHVQGKNEFDSSYAAGMKVFSNALDKLLKSMGGMDAAQRKIYNIIDTFQVSAWSLSKCTEASDLVYWARNTYTLITGESSFTKVASFYQGYINDFMAQGDDEDSEPFAYKLRNIFNMTQSSVDTPLFKKLKSLYCYMLVHGILKPLGIEMSDETFTRLEQKNMLIQYGDKPSFLLHVIDTAIFMLEKAYEFTQTGDICVFAHGDAQYAKWAKQSDKLLALAPFTGNLGAHGTSYFEFMSDLNDAIEKGTAFTKFSIARGDFEGLAIRSKMSKLQLVKNTELTKRSALRERAAPFGVLLSGGSSVAKSSFAKMLFYYYGGLFKLPTDPHYKYTRNPLEEYWSNFDSSMWCIQLDDVAFLLPSKSTDVDPSLKEILFVGNNVPYVPTQAALEDKGKTPVMSELLIATTNTVNLNAHEYFACPLAIRRRLPYVIDVVPKPEYMASNGKFIDPSKLAQPVLGFPDFWIIKVFKVVPYEEGRRELAQLELVGEYTDVHKFLANFGECAQEHKMNQRKAMGCDDYMAQLTVCGVCRMPDDVCGCKDVQAEDAVEDRFVDPEPYTWPEQPSFSDACRDYFLEWYAWYVETMIQLHLFRFVLRIKFFRTMIYRHVSRCLPDITQIRVIGILNGTDIAPERWQKLRKIAGYLALAAAGTGAAYYGVQWYKNRTDKKVVDPVETTEPIVKTPQEVEDNLDMQGVNSSILSEEAPMHPEDQLLKEKRNNVWYNPSIELTKFDVPPASQSLAGCTPSTARDLFSRNSVFIEVRYIRDGENRVSRMCGSMIKGHYCLVPAHLFPKGISVFRVTIIRSAVADGINGNIEFELHSEEVIIDFDKELAIFKVTGIPPVKDITKFWTDKPIRTTRCCVVRRTPNGSVDLQEAFGVANCVSDYVPALDRQLMIYPGRVEKETQNGDCGAMYVALTPRGPVIIGFHLLGRSTDVGILSVCVSDIESLIERIDARDTFPYVVQGLGEPMLSCSTRTNVVGELHHRSMVRYMSEGTANMYGTFVGFRNKPKSKVGPTPLQEKFLEHYGTEVGYDKPCMRGWEPWSKNVTEMVKQKYTYSRDVLQEVSNNFFEDVMSGLPEGWEKELVILSDAASVNGIPGVMYVDGMNFNSSMGFPWNSSKRGHIVPAPDAVRPDAVDFDAELWERVRSIETQYAAGERAFPVFMGHLKDTATPLKQCESKKTRLFTGAPVDWSIVVRKNLLTFIRMLQKNRLVFEAGPGTICQSRQWTEIHEYLVAFGPDRIVAGDYGKYDKHMTSDFILEAFKFIARIFERAGHSKKVLQTIMGIGTDTAFPLCNINADLIEFYGTNPSGHPLTVIVNSIVNSLYMRYVYKTLNPLNECTSFKKNVHLFTYGDDNIMGVARGADWFNHTAIQAALAKIGVEYTMAEKEAGSVPFISIDECQFLKRKWRFEPEVDAYLCPLDEASIIKSLTVWLPSSSIDEYKQMVAVMSSACCEYFFYGRETFERHRTFFLSLTAEFPYSVYVIESTFPTWAELVDRFHRASEPAEVCD